MNRFQLSAQFVGSGQPGAPVRASPSAASAAPGPAPQANSMQRPQPRTSEPDVPAVAVPTTTANGPAGNSPLPRGIVESVRSFLRESVETLRPAINHDGDPYPDPARGDAVKEPELAKVRPTKRTLVPVELDLTLLLSLCPELCEVIVNTPDRFFELVGNEIKHVAGEAFAVLLRRNTRITDCTDMEHSMAEFEERWHQRCLYSLVCYLSKPDENLVIRPVNLPQVFSLSRMFSSSGQASRIGVAALSGAAVQYSTHRGRLTSVVGTIVRMGTKQVVPLVQSMVCPLCGTTFDIATSPYNRLVGTNTGGSAEKPDDRCTNKSCRRQQLTLVDGAGIWINYLECRIQQHITACANSEHLLSQAIRGRGGDGATGGGGGGGQSGTDRLSLPRSVIVSLEDELCSKVCVGQFVEAVGVVMPRWKHVSQGNVPICELVLRAFNIFPSDASVVANLGTSVSVGGAGGIGCAEQWGNNDGENTAGSRAVSTASTARCTLATATPEEYAASFSRPGALLATLVKSVAPQLFGLFFVRLGILLAAVGGVPLHSVSQQRRPRYGGGGGGGAAGCSRQQQRGTIHVLLVGDPSTGKSQLLRFAVSMAPRGVSTAGMTSTAAGLTVSAAKENGEWILEPGALVLSDGGVCAIDELRTVAVSDRTSLHEAMEQQTISVAKAGIVTSLRTCCSVIAACNPPATGSRGRAAAAGAARGYSSIDLGIGGPLLSRFDLIFLLWDDRDHDEAIATHILNGASMGHSSGGAGAGAGTEATVDGAFTAPVTLPQLKTYTTVACERFRATSERPQPVKLGDKAERLLGKYYAAQRSRGASPYCEGLPTTLRLLESMIRLTQACAKLTFSSECTGQHAALAILVMEHTAHALKIPLRSHRADLVGRAASAAPGGGAHAELYTGSKILDSVFLDDSPLGCTRQNHVLDLVAEAVDIMPPPGDMVEPEEEEPLPDIAEGTSFSDIALEAMDVPDLPRGPGQGSAVDTATPIVALGTVDGGGGGGGGGYPPPNPMLSQQQQQQHRALFVAEDFNIPIVSSGESASARSAHGEVLSAFRKRQRSPSGSDLGGGGAVVVDAQGDDDIGGTIRAARHEFQQQELQRQQQPLPQEHARYPPQGGQHQPEVRIQSPLPPPMTCEPSQQLVSRPPFAAAAGAASVPIPSQQRQPQRQPSVVPKRTLFAQLQMHVASANSAAPTQGATPTQHRPQSQQQQQQLQRDALVEPVVEFPVPLARQETLVHSDDALLGPDLSPLLDNNNGNNNSHEPYARRNAGGGRGGFIDVDSCDDNQTGRRGGVLSVAVYEEHALPDLFGAPPAGIDDSGEATRMLASARGSLRPTPQRRSTGPAASPQALSPAAPRSVTPGHPSAPSSLTPPVAGPQQGPRRGDGIEKIAALGFQAAPRRSH